MKKNLSVALASFVALAMLVSGGGWLLTSVLGKAEPQVITIGENTEVLTERWCLACSEYGPVAEDNSWRGKNREQLADLLAQEYPGSRILSFTAEQVVVLLPPAYCEKCMAALPTQGYISVTEGNQLAVFSADGALFKTYGDAPGAWLSELNQGIPFSSPQDCLDWLINLTS